MIRKSTEGKLTEVEALALKGLDLALLSKYEQARELTNTLLNEWLTQYNFRDWTKHRSNPGKKGQPVKDAEKKERSEEIANILSDNKIWHSYGRQIDPKTLQTMLRLDIEDLAQRDLQAKVRRYTEFVIPYVIRYGYRTFIRSRNWF